MEKIFDKRKIEEKYEENEIQLLISFKDKIPEEIRNINKILKIFLNNENDKKKIENITKNIMSYDSFIFHKKIILGVYYFIKSFNNTKKTDLFTRLEQIIMNIKNNNEMENNINLINGFLKDIDIDISDKKQKQDNLIDFLCLMKQFPEALKWLRDKDKNSFMSLSKFIIDSDIDEHLTLEMINLTNVKEYFEKLNNIEDIKIIKILINTLNPKKINDSNLGKEIMNYMHHFSYLAKLNNIKEGKKNYVDKLLSEINKLSFHIQYDENKEKYELKKVLLDGENMTENYNELIEKSFFAVSHSRIKSKDSIYLQWKKIIEINNNYY